jgi:hypothetical protein
MDTAPLVGKTYSLQDATASSDSYFERIGSIADSFLDQSESLPKLLSIVQRTSSNKRKLKKISLASIEASTESILLGSLNKNFSEFTTNVETHLRGLSLLQVWDKGLATSERQYHLYMLEIELINRFCIHAFRLATTRLAFLPHCLHDLKADCRRTVRGDDYMCKGCSEECEVNVVSKMLRRHGVKPYIWMTANLKSLFNRLRKEGKQVGVLGIACIPELVNGMRMCIRAGVPVVGVPLDANRCVRWWGEFHPNSVNVRVLENLLGDETLVLPRRPKLMNAGVGQ